jgi:uncharacterized protein (UPF0332 family)
MRESAQLALDKSEETLNDAIFNLQEKRYGTVANRTYYAVYYAAQALLFDKDVFTKTHTGVGSKLSELYVKTNLLDKKIGKLFSALSQMRQTADYDFTHVIEKEEAELAVDYAKQFFKIVKDWFDKSDHIEP